MTKVRDTGVAVSNVKALTLKLDASMRKAVSLAAGMADVSRTEWIRQAIAEKLKTEGVKFDG